jgi:hypothetical protein
VQEEHRLDEAGREILAAYTGPEVYARKKRQPLFLNRQLERGLLLREAEPDQKTEAPTSNKKPRACRMSPARRKRKPSMREVHSDVEPIDRVRERHLRGMPNQVRILGILDKSGSMKPHEGRVIESLRAFLIKVHEELPAGSQALLTCLWQQGGNVGCPRTRQHFETAASIAVLLLATDPHRSL